jgi:hypothetical protein
LLAKKPLLFGLEHLTPRQPAFSHELPTRKRSNAQRVPTDDLGSSKNGVIVPQQVTCLALSSRAKFLCTEESNFTPELSIHSILAPRQTLDSVRSQLEGADSEEPAGLSGEEILRVITTTSQPFNRTHRMLIAPIIGYPPEFSKQNTLLYFKFFPPREPAHSRRRPLVASFDKRIPAPFGNRQ